MTMGFVPGKIAAKLIACLPIILVILSHIWYRLISRHGHKCKN